MPNTDVDLPGPSCATGAIANPDMMFNFHCGAPWAPWCAAASGPNPSSWRVSTDHHDVWGSTTAILTDLGRVANRSAPGAFGDADVLMTGGAGCDARPPNGGLRCPGMTEVECVVWRYRATGIPHSYKVGTFSFG